jgi:hypothetical protein
VATEKRLPQFPDDAQGGGMNWVDGAYRGIAVRSTPPAVRKQVPT